tara:strand:+ start:38210 stop:39538 length:1329 start_codon:yes stop_codon:yes gene_type:complete
MSSCGITPIISAGSRKARAYFFLNTGTPGVRFLQYDEPTEGTFRELFDSVGFLSDCRDTAKKEEQGFVVCAKDQNAIDRDSTPDANGYTKSVLPHQLPNVYAKDDGCGVEVTQVINTRDCCDGTALDFEVTNTMVVDDNDDKDVNGNPNPVEVTQAGPGCDTHISFKPTDVHNDNGVQVEPGKVVVCPDDTESKYLSEVLTTETPCTVDISAKDTDADGNCEVVVNVKPWLLGEIKMISGTVLNDTTCFAGSIGVGQFEGWHICDGTNSTIDLRKKFIAGYDPTDPEYSNPGVGIAGSDCVSLGSANVPLRTHSHVVQGSGTLTTNTDGAHNHIIRGIRGGGSGTSCEFDGGVDVNPANRKGSNILWYTGPFTGTCDPKSAAFAPDGPHSHTVNASSMNIECSDASITDPAEIECHENRPTFTAMVFIQYVGETLCADCPAP